MTEHKSLQHTRYHEQASCRAGQPRQDKEQSPRFLRGSAEALVEVSVNGGEAAFVKQRHQHGGYNKVTDNIAENRLQVAELRQAYFAGHGNKGHAGQGIADKAKRHQVPYRIAVACKIRLRIIFARGKIGHEQQHAKVSGNTCQKHNWSHKWRLN